MLQPTDCLVTTLLKHAWQRYLTAIFVVELFFNQIAGINSRTATLLKRSLRRGGFFVNTLEFSALLQKGLTWALFSSVFDKIASFVLQGLNLIKTFSIIDFFLKIFLRQLFFDTYWGKNLWWSFFIEELQSGHCKDTTLLKKLHHRRFPEKSPNFRNHLFFRKIFISVKEWNYMKDYLKVRREAKGSERLLPFSQNIKHLLE